jgi:hypothetical protein
MFPGILFSESSTKETKITDPKAVAKKAPKGAFCFYFENWVEKKSVVDGEKFEKTEQVGKSSAKHYIGGEVYTLAELQEKFRGDERHSTLLSNIKGNGYKRAIHCSTGNWQPFEEGDVLVKV